MLDLAVAVNFYNYCAQKLLAFRLLHCLIKTNGIRVRTS